MHTKATRQLTRGQVARELNINPETLRYYEVQKLIKKPVRLINNYRVYDENDIERLKFIVMAKKLGFSLKEIKELLNLALDVKGNREKVRTLAKQKSQILAEKITQLSNLKKILDKLIKTCQIHKASKACPILETLYQK